MSKKNTVYINFENIDTYGDFYTQLKEKISLPTDFDSEIESLPTLISQHNEMPLHLEFVNMSIDQLEVFEALLDILENIEDTPELTFSYYLEQYED